MRAAQWPLVVLQGRSLRVAVVAYLVAVVTSEAVIAFVDPAYGVACEALLLLLLMAYTVLEPRSPRHIEANGSLRAIDVFPALALVPLLRILSVAMPFPDLPRIWWYAASGAPLLLALALTLRFYGREYSLETLKFGWSYVQGGIALTGIPLSLLGYAILRPDRIEPHFRPLSFVLGCLILLVFTGLTEELLFRGVVQRLMVELFGAQGILLGTLLFTSMYLGVSSALFTVFVAAVGFWFAWCVRRTVSLLGVTLAHGFVSIGLILVWPYVLG
jgi:uncharacterized protein